MNGCRCITGAFVVDYKTSRVEALQELIGDEPHTRPPSLAPVTLSVTLAVTLTPSLSPLSPSLPPSLSPPLPSCCCSYPVNHSLSLAEIPIHLSPLSPLLLLFPCCRPLTHSAPLPLSPSPCLPPPVSYPLSPIPCLLAPAS